MRSAASLLLGEHDFSAFRAAGCQSSSAAREVRLLTVERRGHWVSVTVTANAFLQHMVRNIVGVLAEIGSGERDPGWAREVLEGRDRTAGGVAAPAHGLTLVRVQYPEDYGIPDARVPDLLPGLD